MREVIRNVQTARKAAGLNVDDRISLALEAKDSELDKAIDEHFQAIAAETLAENMHQEGKHEYETTVQVEGKELIIRITKA